ncbi:retrotransposon ORF1 [Tanacetum coccineum]
MAVMMAPLFVVVACVCYRVSGGLAIEITDSDNNLEVVSEFSMELPMAEKTCIGRITTPSGCDLYLCNHGCDVKYGPDVVGVCFINTICLCYYKCPPSPPMNLDVANHGASPLPTDAP